MSQINRAACRAINSAGGPAALAKQLLNGKHTRKEYVKMQRRICWWKRNGVAHKFVLKVEAITGVSRHDLDPELYPKDVA